MFEALRDLYRHRHLVTELTRREHADRYLGHWIGGMWAFLNPILLYGLYAVLFTVVFPSRLPESGSTLVGFLYILCALVPWVASAEVINRSVHSIVSNASLVRQVVFPLEVLPYQAVTMPLLNFSIGLLLCLGLLAAYEPERLLVALPLGALAILLHLMFLAGLAFLFASLGVFARDLKDLLGFFTGAGLFLAPILYFPEVIDRMPDVLRFIIAANPFTAMVHTYRDALFHGGFNHPGAWILMAFAAPLTLSLGYACFDWLKPQFAEAV